ncbi:hypothetical protein FRB97_003408 [Tulasnella sp. 331]|nr:hypothetical protein FRB97_003408 [Tulasnella sp. 331]
MSLSNGTYVINSLVDDRFVGRHPVEDLSLLPKRILAVTPNFQARRNTVEKSDSGCLIRAEGAPLAVYNGLVYGFLIEMQLAENWVITPQPQEGGDVYTGALKLESVPSLPAALFKFTRIDDD